MELSSKKSNSVSDFYTTGSYWKTHRNSDSTYKVELFDEMSSKLKIVIPNKSKIAEIGCGQGAFLFPFAKYLKNKSIDVQLFGYDIASDAIALAKERNFDFTTDNLNFVTGGADAIPKGLDFIFIMDVVEHVDDPYLFLNNLKGKSKCIVLHLPIEHSIGHLLLNSATSSYNRFKHVHFYSWETAKLLLEETKFKIIGYHFTGASEKALKNNGSIINKTLRYLRFWLYKLSPNFVAKLAGGSVLLLLEDY